MMKKLLIALAALVVLIIIAAIVAPFLIPVDTYKYKLISLVKEATGRDLRIDGPVRFSILPQLALEANGVAFSNAPGAKSPDMVKLKQLQVELRLMPLLHGSVEIARFVLVEPDIALEVDKTGKPNWVMTTSEKKPAAPAASGGGTPAPAEIRLDDVRLDNGRLSYLDARTGKSQEVTGIKMKISLPDLDTKFTADGGAVWNGENVALTLAVDKPRLLLTGKESGIELSLAASPVKLGFTGKVSGLPAAAKVAGAIDFAVPSVRGLAKWAGSPLPDGGGLGPLAIKGKIDMAGTKIAFSDATISIDAIMAKGAVSVDNAGKRPALKGQLAVDKLDVNPYLPPENPAPGKSGTASSAGGGGAAPASQAGWSDAPIDTSGLGLADADFDLSADAILYRKIEIGKSALDVHLKDSKLTANLTQLALYEGKGQGKVSLDGAAAPPAIAITFALNGVQVGPLLTAMGNDKLSGQGKFDIDVTGKGKSQRALIGALNGKGSLNLANGVLKGANLLDLANNAKSSLAGGSSNNAGTNFGTLSATYTIANGVIQNNDLVIKSGAVPITGGGKIDLPDRTIDYRVTVSIAGAVSVPVKVTGPIDDPSYRPDLAGAVGDLIKTPGKALEGVTSGAEKGATGVGNTLKGLFGK
jgi:AsmA protein